ncbi:hypothetical protein [Streptomyces sp. KR80]|uniref:hypothetical protein n=1 Tax=Streptomyces sp. KR80 TaxID=3457426 RepID=UPI003FD15A67
MSHLQGQGAFAHGGGAAERPRFLHLMLPWAVGIVVILLGQVAVTLLVWDVIADRDPRFMVSASRTILLVHVPTAICFALGTWAAAGVHREPSRDSLLRHLAASLIPAVGIQLTVFLSQGDSLTLMSFALQLGVLLAGCALGFFADRLWSGRS